MKSPKGGSLHLICFFLRPLLILRAEINFRGWKVHRENINRCISKASNHFPETAHVKAM
jgi:hypothetical protein